MLKYTTNKQLSCYKIYYLFSLFLNQLFKQQGIYYVIFLLRFQCFAVIKCGHNELLSQSPNKAILVCFGIYEVSSLHASEKLWIFYYFFFFLSEQKVKQKKRKLTRNLFNLLKFNHRSVHLVNLLQQISRAQFQITANNNNTRSLSLCVTNSSFCSSPSFSQKINVKLWKMRQNCVRSFIHSIFFLDAFHTLRCW